MKAYLVQSSTALSESGQTVYTVTLAIPNLTTEEYIRLVEEARELGEVSINVTEVPSVRV